MGVLIQGYSGYSGYSGVYGRKILAINDGGLKVAADTNCCCEHHECDATLLCDSISASGGKCGYLALDGSNKYYLQKVVETTTNSEYHAIPADPFSEHTSNCVDNRYTNRTRIRDPDSDPPCEEVEICSGTGTVHTDTAIPPTSFDYSGDWSTCAWVGTITTAPPCGLEGFDQCVDTGPTDTVFGPDYKEYSSSTDCTQSNNSSTGQSSFLEAITLSNEETTETMMANVVALLPAYDDDFNDSCIASRDLSDDESGYTIQRFRYKFTVPEGHEICTIRWIERFTPDVGSSEDTNMEEDIPAGETESSIYEVNEPSSDGSIEIIYPIP